MAKLQYKRGAARHDTHTKGMKRKSNYTIRNRLGMGNIMDS